MTAPSRSVRTLLAEDEPESAKWLVRALQQGGFKVNWVDDGHMLRRSLEAMTYDARVLDLGSPGVGGHDMLGKRMEQNLRLASPITNGERGILFESLI